MRSRMALGLVVLAACARSTGGGPVPVRLPVKAEDLSRDLRIFASDSFAGRETGTSAAMRAARFLVSRVMALGLEPAGDSLYMQRVPMVRSVFASGTRITVNEGQSAFPLAIGGEVAPWMNLGPGAPLPRRSAEGELVFAGYGLNTLGRNDFQGITQEGRVIVMLHGAPPSIRDSATREKLESQDEMGQRILRALQLRPSAIILLMTAATKDFYMQALPDLLRPIAIAPGDQSSSDTQRPLPMILLGVARTGSRLLPPQWPNDEAPQALGGRRLSARLDVRQDPFTGYNVVAVVRGSDPRLNKTYVAYGAHYDHIGIQPGMSPDSIANGADDDGSGSVTMLALAKSVKAALWKRSALFVWHVGEEKGLLGSTYFVDHPTVPIDSIVAQLNADMIGRRGGPTKDFNSVRSGLSALNSLFVVGPNAAPNNQSKVLGAILDSVNARQIQPFRLDHTWDSPTHPEHIYTRSDHYNYARKGIPILFLTTGLHEDYHKVSDDITKIDFDKMARIGSLMLDVGTTLGNRASRPR